jgi:hypothetical protein
VRIRWCPAAVSTNPRRRRDDALSLFTGKHPNGAGYGLHQCVYPQFVQPPPVIIQCSIRAHFFDLPGIIGRTFPRDKGVGDPNGIRTRVTAVKERY